MIISFEVSRIFDVPVNTSQVDSKIFFTISNHEVEDKIDQI